MGFSSGNKPTGIVDTTSAQTLSNKTLTNPEIDCAIIVEELCATPSNPCCGFIKVYAKCDGALYTLNSCGSEAEAGGSGGGGLDTFYTEIFECGVCCFTSGNNACFDNGGCVVGTLANDTVTPITGCTSLKYTSTACSACDWISSPTIILCDKQVGNKVSLIGYTTYTGDDNDIQIVLFDDTCNVVVSPCCAYIKAGTIPRRFNIQATVPCCAANLKWGFRTITGNACAVLIMDDVELTTAPREVKDFTVTNSIGLSGNSGGSYTANANMEFNGTGTGWNSGTYEYTVQYSNAQVTIDASIREGGIASSHNSLSIKKNGVIYKILDYKENSTALIFKGVYVSKVGEFAKGDLISINYAQSVTLTNEANNHYLNIVETSDSNGTVFATDYNKADLVVTGAGNSASTTVADVTRIDFIPTSDTQCLWSESACGNGFDTFTAPETGVYDITGMLRIASGVSIVLKAFIDDVVGPYIESSTSSSKNKSFSANIYLQKDQTLDLRLNNAQTFENNTQIHWITISRQGLDLDNLIVENFGNIVSACGLGTGDLENNFSARIANNGTSSITSESQTFICSVCTSGSGVVDIVFTPCFFSEIPAIEATTNVSGVTAAYTSLTACGVTINATSHTGVAVNQPFSFTASRQGTDYQSKTNYIDNLIIENPCGGHEVGYIKDVKASGTQGGTFTSGAWQTRDLGTTSGDFSSFGSLACNQFTLQAGTYVIEATAPGRKVAFHQARLRNITNCTDIRGSVEYSHTSDNATTTSFITGKVTVTSATVFEIQHRAGTTNACDGFGTNGSLGDEIYTQVKITKPAIQLGVVPGSFRPVKIGYVKDVKASGTAGGTFTSGAWRTRNLNTTEGDFSEFGTLAFCQITLTAGTYHIEADAPAYLANRHKIKLRNITDCTDVIIGGNAEADAGAAGHNHAPLKGVIVITSSKTFEIHHRCQTTSATHGFGLAASFSVDEVYVQVKITKIV